ncbi:MAG TPA: hypothetical protein VG796_09000, partial [Verrucomicrobiales bacterium]|nr:hypothetical protein [Verrucomicrobiales bacterium]
MSTSTHRITLAPAAIVAAAFAAGCSRKPAGPLPPAASVAAPAIPAEGRIQFQPLAARAAQSAS